jgi:hypothetical protein
MNDEILIHCSACQAQVRLQVSMETLEIRFCPKCGAAVTPVGTAPTDAASEKPASSVRPIAPQLLPGTSAEPAPFTPSRGIPTAPKTLGAGTPTVQVKPGESSPPRKSTPPVADPSQHVREAPIPFVPVPPVHEDPLPAIVLEHDDDVVPLFNLDSEQVKPASAPPPPPASPAPSLPATPAPFSVLPSAPPVPRESIPVREAEPPPKAGRAMHADVQRELTREGKKKARREKSERSLLNLPLWEGVYTFPFRFENLRVVILLVISLTFMGLLGCAMHSLVSMMFEKAGPADMTAASSILDRAALYVFLCLLVLGVFVSLYQAAIFLRVVEETSAGIDNIGWPKDPWFEFLGKWLFLGWAFVASTGLWAMLMLPIVHVLPIPRAVGWVFVLLLGWFTFPVVLFSTMAASAFWMLVHPPLLLRMVQKPVAVAFLYINAGLFLFPSAILAYGLIGEYHYALLLFAGPVWTISLLCYGRVLGRVGFELMREDGRRLRIQT